MKKGRVAFIVISTIALVIALALSVYFIGRRQVIKGVFREQFTTNDTYYDYTEVGMKLERFGHYIIVDALYEVQIKNGTGKPTVREIKRVYDLNTRKFLEQTSLWY